jgi:uncharacterized protein with von Willebrand factor type A (vWA) domain
VLNVDKRIVEFVAALRAAGVRVSIAESEDAFQAVQQMGVLDRRDFQDALRATLVKEARDRPTFDQLFSLYFGSGGPPLMDLTQDLSPEEQQLLAQALQALLSQLRQAAESVRSRESDDEVSEADARALERQLDSLMQLLQWLLRGVNPAGEDPAVQGRGAPPLPGATEWSNQLRRQLASYGRQVLRQLMDALAELLAQMGMGQEAVEQLLEGMEANQQALSKQIAQQLGTAAARREAERFPQRKQDISSLMHRPFGRLTEREAEVLREQVRRLAAQLRSRAALRRKRGKRGIMDVKQIMRTNLRYGGVPLELKFKTRHQKPKLLLICDISTSMRPVVEFLLRLIYELQDQVASAHSFAFIDDLNDISPDFAEHTPQVAIRTVLRRLPPGHYNTDLGRSLGTLMARFSGVVDPRTTVIFVGDARNNYNDPRLDLMERIQRRSKRIIWLNPEHPQQWGTGDSDMPAYLPYAHSVHRVSNLVELTAAVDKLLGG